MCAIVVVKFGLCFLNELTTSLSLHMKIEIISSTLLGDNYLIVLKPRSFAAFFIKLFHAQMKLI